MPRRDPTAWYQLVTSSSNEFVAFGITYPVLLLPGPVCLWADWSGLPNLGIGDQKEIWEEEQDCWD